MFQILIKNIMNCCINEHDVEQTKIINNKKSLKRKKKSVYFNENDNQYYLLN